MSERLAYDHTHSDRVRLYSSSRTSSANNLIAPDKGIPLTYLYKIYLLHNHPKAQHCKTSPLRNQKKAVRPERMRKDLLETDGQL